MSANRKPPSPKKSWQATRRRFTWHLHVPEFDRRHWWNETGQPANPVAALYELARRHPLVAETLLRGLSLPGSEPPTWAETRLEELFPQPPSLRFLSWNWMKPWTQLAEGKRAEWKLCIGKLKGFDFRQEGPLCRNLTRLAHSIIYQHREEARKKLAASLPPAISGTSEFGLYSPLADSEWRESVAQAAVQAHREGYVLLAVAPDLAPDKLQSAVSEKYREHLSLHPRLETSQTQRACPLAGLASANRRIRGRRNQAGRGKIPGLRPIPPRCRGNPLCVVGAVRCDDNSPRLKA